MLNQSGIEKVTGMTKKSIIIDNKLMFATSCVIANAGVTAGGDGKKIVKAGTPLKGSLKARNTAFTVAKKDDTGIVGILETDVDVTKGNANGACIVFGFIDESKLDSSVVTLLDTTNTDSTKIRDHLAMITFIK